MRAALKPTFSPLYIGSRDVKARACPLEGFTSFGRILGVDRTSQVCSQDEIGSCSDVRSIQLCFECVRVCLILYGTPLVWHLNRQTDNFEPASNYQNASATTLAPAAHITSCPLDCARGPVLSQTYTWVSLAISTTITHATVFTLIDPAGHTSLSTHFETDLGGFKVPNNTNVRKSR